jgi:hypothetical protein
MNRTTTDIGNTAFHSAIIVGLATGYSKLIKLIFKTVSPKLGLDMHDMLFMTLDVGAALITRDYLIKQKIIPANIMN